jgi:hypothetical protein
MMLLALIAAAAATQPNWTLTPNGLGPVHIGMTRAQVEHALHSRLKANYPPDSEADCTEMSPVRSYRGLILLFENRRLSRISLVKPSRIATVKGIRVGATDRQVQQAYGMRIRAEPNHYEDPPAQYLTVWTDAGKRGLRFETDEHRRVYAIHAGTGSIQYIEGCL